MNIETTFEQATILTRRRAATDPTQYIPTLALAGGIFEIHRDYQACAASRSSGRHEPRSDGGGTALRIAGIVERQTFHWWWW
jgi:hypothetical protein